MATVTFMTRSFVGSIATDKDTATSNASRLPIVTVSFDAVPSEQHSGSNTVTSHPVEEGADISDHSRPEPDTVSLDIFISNTPLSQEQMQRAAQSGAVSAAKANDAPSWQPGYAEKMLQNLWDLKDSGTLVTAITSIRGRVYRSTLIESISVPRDAKVLDAVRATIGLKKVRIVKNKLTRAVVSRDKRVGAKVKTGNQTPGQDEVDQSAADKMYEGAKGKDGFFGKLGGALGALTK